MGGGREVVYSVATLALTAGTFYYAFQLNTHFFPSMVYLWKSKACTLVLGNFALWLLLSFGRLGIRFFLGELRAQEVELLGDNMRPTVMSLLFFLTIFRTQFNASFIAALVVLICSKAVHWVAEARVNSMEQSPSDSKWEYVRLAALLVLMFLVDQTVVYWAAVHTMEVGPSLLLLFGFEYCILALTAAGSFVSFVLNYISIQRDQMWHAKGTYVLYLEFVVSALKSLVYLAFFFIIFRYYGLPLHIVRSMYLTFASFQRSLAKLLTYRRAVSSMDVRYPDASPEDLQNVDSICIVCRDEMEAGKKLPCGHILHRECLRSWLQQDPSCPLCRKSVIIEDLYRAEPHVYVQEYQRFMAQRAGHAAPPRHHPHHPHEPFRAPPQGLAEALNHFTQQAQQQQHQREQEAASVAVAKVEALEEQVGAIKTQLDFIQSLLIAQMERDQQQQQEEEKRKNDATEEEIRQRRLQFYKE